MNERLWYAKMVYLEEDDWGYGTFDRREAESWMHEFNEELEAQGLDRDAYIAVIEAGYDEDGLPTKDALCVGTIKEDGFTGRID